MKKKNYAKKALAPALLGAICSLVALTSVSYAWFTMGNKAEVGQLDVNVQAADGLQISADAANWKSILDIDTLKDANATLGSANTKLAPVSSTGSVTAGVQSIFYAEQQTDQSLLGKVAVAGTDYLMFDLYVKVDNDKKLSIESTSKVTGLAEHDKDSELATRVSFVDLGSVAADANYTAEKATGLNISGVNGNAVIWEPNSTAHTSVAAAAGATGKVAYKGIASVAEPADGKELGLATLSNENVTTSDNTSGLEVATLEAGVNKIRVYIWLEGQDADCTNEISDSGFSVKLNFSVPEEQGQ